MVDAETNIIPTANPTSMDRLLGRLMDDVLQGALRGIYTEESVFEGVFTGWASYKWRVFKQRIRFAATLLMRVVCMIVVQYARPGGMYAPCCDLFEKLSITSWASDTCRRSWVWKTYEVKCRVLQTNDW